MICATFLTGNVALDIIICFFIIVPLVLLLSIPFHFARIIKKNKRHISYEHKGHNIELVTGTTGVKVFVDGEIVQKCVFNQFDGYYSIKFKVGNDNMRFELSIPYKTYIIKEIRFYINNKDFTNKICENNENVSGYDDSGFYKDEKSSNRKEKAKKSSFEKETEPIKGDEIMETMYSQMPDIEEIKCSLDKIAYQYNNHIIKLIIEDGFAKIDYDGRIVESCSVEEASETLDLYYDTGENFVSFKLNVSDSDNSKIVSVDFTIVDGDDVEKNVEFIIENS